MDLMKLKMRTYVRTCYLQTVGISPSICMICSNQVLCRFSIPFSPLHNITASQKKAITVVIVGSVKGIDCGKCMCSQCLDKNKFGGKKACNLRNVTGCGNPTP